MTIDERQARIMFRAANGLAALVVSAGLLAVCELGAGPVPALGRSLVPGHGAWQAAACRLMPVSPGVPLAELAGSYGAGSHGAGPHWAPVVGPDCGATSGGGRLP